MIEEAKKRKIAIISEYDNSSFVNEFYLNGKAMWVDVELRVRLRNIISVEQKKGSNTFTEWYNGIPYTFTCEVWDNLLNEVEHYAYECLCVTEQHKANVMLLSSVEEINRYDHTQGYPKKLNISL